MRVGCCTWEIEVSNAVARENGHALFGAGDGGSNGSLGGLASFREGVVARIEIFPVLKAPDHLLSA